MSKWCIVCGCSEMEARQQTCIGGTRYHQLRSTEERGSGSKNHKERYLG